MGLATNVETWPMPAAIGMATEGIKAKHYDGTSGGGFGAADHQIGIKMDGAKVLVAIERMQRKAPHLAAWSLFAYASPSWNASSNTACLIESVLNDWVVQHAEQGVIVQKRTYAKIKAMTAVIAAGLALQHRTGCPDQDAATASAMVSGTSRQYLIQALVAVDVQDKADTSDAFQRQRTRYYQNHWSNWAKHVLAMRALLLDYDRSARGLFSQELENQSRA
ncbi:hypothetical protein ACODM8_19570 [Vibrio ostreicida]|uniref:hypothetical protein n=1 Tax=Vibrio ostreicida TaxID=526588 RepID=UPI00097045EE|nr:hypothetical protein [Vibrio ostreicida]